MGMQIWQADSGAGSFLDVWAADFASTLIAEVDESPSKSLPSDLPEVGPYRIVEKIGSGAMGVLVNISGSSSMTMEEFEEASTIIHEKVHEDANIIWGSAFNPDLDGKIRVSVETEDCGEGQGMGKAHDFPGCGGRIGVS